MTCATAPNIDHHSICIKHLLSKGCSPKQADDKMKRADKVVSHWIVTTPIAELSAELLVRVIKAELIVDGEEPDYWLCFHCLNDIIRKRRKG